MESISKLVTKSYSNSLLKGTSSKQYDAFIENYTVALIVFSIGLVLYIFTHFHSLLVNRLKFHNVLVYVQGLRLKQCCF